MVHDVKDRMKQRKLKKRSRKEASSSSSSSESSSDESPARQKDSRKTNEKLQGRRQDKDAAPMKQKVRENQDDRSHKKEKIKQKESRKRESSSSASSSSSDEDTPQRQKKEKQADLKVTEKGPHYHEDSRRRKESTREGRDDSHHRERRKDKDEIGHGVKKNSKDRRGKRQESPPAKIKREEDFDRRQDELRRKRRDEERRNRNRHSHHNVRVKQEPGSGDDRRRRHNREWQQGGRPRHRNDMERERRENDAKRAEAWQKREKQGGQNAEALIQDTEEPKEKEKPNLGLSGALTEDTNSFRGVVIKYSEPPEARIPKKRWRLYPFKGDETLKVLHLHRQSAYLLGKLRRIADIPIDHPSCSKQHAVLQFRIVHTEMEDGRKKRLVKPYIIDLESSNGTFVNNQKIEPRRYVELKEKDVLKFAFSSREYVLIHEKSDTTGVDKSDEESDE